MTAHDLIAEFSALFTPPTRKESTMFERYIHPPSPSARGEAALVGYVYIARGDLNLGGGRIIPRGTVLEPGTVDDPHALTGARKVWALDPEALGYLLATLEAGEPDRQPDTADTPTRARGAEAKATNARARARQSYAPALNSDGPVADPGEAEAANPPPTREGLRGARYLEARAWLVEALSKGPRLAAELFDEGDEALHSRRNLERACSELGIESYQEGRAWWKRFAESDRQTLHTNARAREVGDR